MKSTTYRVINFGFTRWLVFIVAIIGLIPFLTIWVPFVASRYVSTLVFLILLFIVYANSWNLLSGFTGYFNFGFAWLLGLGAYVVAILIADFQVFWLIACFTGAIFTALISLPIGWIMLRIKGVYFAIATLSLAEGTRVLFGSKYLSPITRAGYGIPFTMGADFNTLYFTMLFLAIISIVITYKIATSQFGLQLLAIREDEQAAQTVGIDTTRKKVVAFVLSALLAGFASGIHAGYVHYIEPFTVFNMNWTARTVVMAIFGGTGTVAGPVVGALLFTLIEEALWIRLKLAYLSLFGLALILIVLFLPQGIVEWLKEKKIIPRTRKI